jgi:FkbM family methyltransferase
MNGVDFARRHVQRFRHGPDVEQKLVQAFFGTAPGYYVDVGANDPVVDSQSWHLEQRGWTGLLVEPHPDCCARLRAQRTGTVVERACSSPDNAGKELLLHRAGAHGAHSTVEATPIARGTGATVDSVAVRCDTLDHILEEHGARPGFELFSIDIEGHELPALSGFDFRRWQPRLVLLEDHVTHLAKHRLMEGQGYQLVLRTGLNSWYVPRAQAFTHGVAARLERLRKYYLGLPLRKLRFAR